MTSPPLQTQSPAPAPRPSPLVQKTHQPQPGEPVLCNHCGRTASNGISCQGYCVADSDY